MPNSPYAVLEKEEVNPASSVIESSYAELKRLIERHGLLKPQPLYYTYKTILAFLMVISAWIILLTADSMWIKLLDAVFLAFATTQLGFIGHDAGHRQIFKTAWKNDVVGLVNVLFVGASYFWWVETHNKHHSKPNQLAYDPAIDYSVLAFSNEQALSKRGIQRFLIKYQAWLFIPMMALYPISMRIDSIRFLLQGKHRSRYLEAFLMIVHFVLYFPLLFFAFGPWMAILFMVIHESLFGLYLVSVFVPNHMGMVILEDGTDLDFLTQQVITARNIKGHPLVDFWYGGLNYQIEHHLFPKMARNRLRKAKRIVEDFCREKSIVYYETGFFQSYREILTDLHRVSAALRSA